MTTIYRDKSIRMTEETMASLRKLGWDFYMTGPNEWQWVRFAPIGNVIGIQGDTIWADDLHLIGEIKKRKLTLICRDEP